VTIGQAIKWSTTTLPAGTVNKAYAQTLRASGGTGAIGYAVSSGSLPSGLTLSPSGVLAGTVSKNVAGVYRFSVTATDALGVASQQALSLTVQAGPLAQFALTPSSTQPKAGTALQVTVQALDAYGNAVSGVGTVTLYSSDPQAASLGSHTFTAANNGVFTFSNVVLKSAGLRQFVARAGSVSGTALVTVTAAAPVKLVLVSQPGAEALDAVEAPLQVDVLDAFGNAINAVVTMTLINVANGQSVNFGSGSVTQVSTVNGVATFNDFALDVRGQFQLTFTVGTLSVTSQAFAVTLTSGRQR